MRNVLFSLFAIALAGIAAMAATTAVLNAPVRPSYIGPPKAEQPATPDATPPTTSEPAPSPAPAPAPAPGGPPTTSPTSTSGTPAPAEGTAEPGEAEVDEDPYGDVAEEELPPDLQYDADSSVSFPTNI